MKIKYKHQRFQAEAAKIECARRHFATISTGEVVYSVVKTYL